MKKIVATGFLGICLFTACSPTSDTGGQQLKSNGNGMINDSATPMGANNEQMTRDPHTAVKVGDVNNEGNNSNDSSRSRVDAKGNNSDTGKVQRQ